MNPTCSHHALDSLGWPLGDCPGCVAYRKLMDDWHCEMVLSGTARPDLPTAERPEMEDEL